jgi:hypothetical protein
MGRGIAWGAEMNQTRIKLKKNTRTKGFARRKGLVNMIRRITLPTLLVLLAAGGLPGQLRAQSPSSVLHGRILDPTRLPVPGAQVKAFRDSNTAAVAATSDQNGDFSFTLETGKYTLRISKEKFAEASRTVDLTSNGFDLPDIMLSVAPVSTTVEVSGNAGYVALSTVSATKTLTSLQDVPQSVTVVTRDQMRDQMMMSINDVIAYVPGVTSHQGEKQS